MVLCNFVIEVFVVVFQCVDFLGEQVNEIKETVILLLCLDESGDNLVDLLDAAALLDLLECLLYDGRILHVLVHQSLLLQVGLRQFVHSELHNSNRIGEGLALLHAALLLLLIVELLLIELDVLVLLLESLLEPLDLHFELLF